MKKIFKKATILLAAGISAFTMNFSVLSGITADASCAQRKWNIATKYDEDGYYRDQAIKDNYSSVYVKNTCKYSDRGIYVSVFANNSSNWYYNEWAPAEKCSQYWETLDTLYLYVPGNTARLIRQYIKENNYKYASIIFDRGDLYLSPYYDENPQGVWSPDSTSQQNSKFPTAN